MSKEQKKNKRPRCDYCGAFLVEEFEDCSFCGGGFFFVCNKCGAEFDKDGNSL